MEFKNYTHKTYSITQPIYSVTGNIEAPFSVCISDSKMQPTAEFYAGMYVGRLVPTLGEPEKFKVLARGVVDQITGSTYRFSTPLVAGAFAVGDLVYEFDASVTAIRNLDGSYNFNHAGYVGAGTAVTAVDVVANTITFAAPIAGVLVGDRLSIKQEAMGMLNHEYRVGTYAGYGYKGAPSDAMHGLYVELELNAPRIPYYDAELKLLLPDLRLTYQY